MPSIAEPIHTIVDLGANTGMAAVFFASRYPEARIIAVEPELQNYKVLCRNTRMLPNITPVHAAIWSDDTLLALQTVDASGFKVPDWAYQTSTSSDGQQVQRVEGLSMTTLMARYSLETIDLLKVDVEGAELELFGGNAASWLTATRNVVVETHERFRAGSDGQVSSALAACFTEHPMSGENRVFVRTSARCLNSDRLTPKA